METMHQIKISDTLYQKLIEVQKKYRLSGVGAACEIYIERLEEAAT